VSASLLSFLFIGGCGRDASLKENGITIPLKYAKGFKITQFGDYTELSIISPWDTSKLLNKYFLVNKNLPIPDGLEKETIIRTPIDNVVVYTSVQATIIEQLGALGAIIGICEPEYLTSKKILEAFSYGKIANIGSSTAPNIEKIIDLKAEALVVTPFENSGYGAAEKLGIPIIEGADYMENTPLGRCEWVKFYSLFFEKGEVADSIFTATEHRYNTLKEIASHSTNRPSLLTERKYGGSWFLPGGKSYMAAMYSDAGADYIFKERRECGSFALQFESVLERGIDADIWLLKYSSDTPMKYSDLKNEFAPYSNFRPFKEGNIYMCNTIGNSYYDDITLHPDYILEDLVKIFHPDLLPLHTLRYFQKMEE
jgi:iron complex transport system substrate-binding protein